MVGMLDYMLNPEWPSASYEAAQTPSGPPSFGRGTNLYPWDLPGMMGGVDADSARAMTAPSYYRRNAFPSMPSWPSRPQGRNLDMFGYDENANPFATAFPPAQTLESGSAGATSTPSYLSGPSDADSILHAQSMAGPGMPYPGGSAATAPRPGAGPMMGPADAMTDIPPPTPPYTAGPADAMTNIPPSPGLLNNVLKGIPTTGSAPAWNGSPPSAPGAKAAIPEGSPWDRLANVASTSAPMMLALGSALMGPPNTAGQRLGWFGMPAMQQSMQMQRANATVPIMRDALVRNGMSPDEAGRVAQAAAINPDLMKELMVSTFGPKQWVPTEVTDITGQKKPIFYNPATGEVKRFGGQSGNVVAGTTGGAPGGAPGAPDGRPTLDNFDMSMVNPNVSGWDYVKQYPQEVEAAVRAITEGEAMPTGNPRIQGIMPLAKTVAQKIAMDLGEPELADDALYPQRRAMRVSLANSSNSSMGGILSNGKSAFEHLASLSDRYSALGNYNGPNLPGAGRLAQGANYASSTFATSDRLDKLSAANDAAQKYGEESTKFYTGSGGGEAERLAALRNVNPSSATSSEMAGFLESERDLMVGRLRQKQEQIRETLGQHFLDKHPVITPDLQANLAKVDANIARLRGQAPAAAPAAGGFSTAPNPNLPPPDSPLWQPTSTPGWGFMVH